MNVTCAPVWWIIAVAFAEDSAALRANAEALMNHERFADAVRLYERALQLAPADHEVRYRLGYASFRAGQFAQARAHLTAVVRAAPPAHYSRYVLGRIALLENKPAEAIQWLEPVRVNDWESQLAAAYVAAGQAAKAVPLLRAAIAAQPWDSNLHYRLGRLQQTMGQSELASDSFATATRLKAANREDVEALSAVAQALEERRMEEARAQASRISGRASPDPDSLVALGVLLGGASLTADAVDAFSASVLRKPDSFQGQYNLGVALLRVGRSREAVGPLREAVKLLPQSVEASLTHGLACVMNQLYAEAVPSLERVWQSGQASARAGALLGTSLLRTNQAARAAVVLRQAAGRGGADLNTHLLLLEALNATHAEADALAAALAIAKSFPLEPRAEMAAAQQLARAGRYQEALPRFERVLTLDPSSGEAALGVGDCLQKAGRHEPALAHYRAALAAPSTSLAARLGLARSLLSLRRLEESRAVLEETSRLHPGEPAVEVELTRVRARLAAGASKP